MNQRMTIAAVVLLLAAREFDAAKWAPGATPLRRVPRGPAAYETKVQ